MTVVTLKGRLTTRHFGLVRRWFMATVSRSRLIGGYANTPQIRLQFEGQNAQETNAGLCSTLAEQR